MNHTGRTKWRVCGGRFMAPSTLTHLQVVLRVPVRVEDDAGVGGRQVDSQPSCSGAEQKYKAVRVWLAETVNGRLPQVPPHSAVDAFVRVAEESDTQRQFPDETKTFRK